MATLENSAEFSQLFVSAMTLKHATMLSKGPVLAASHDDGSSKKSLTNTAKQRNWS